MCTLEIGPFDRAVRRRLTPLLIQSAISLVAAFPARSQVLRARATDAQTEDPIARASITVLGDVAQRELDSSGRILLPLKRGGATVVIVRRLGYSPLSTTLDVPEHDTLNVHFVMQRAPAQLDTVSVNAKVKPYVPLMLRDFEDRRAHRVASFVVTPEDIERQVPVHTSDLLHRALGVSVAEKGMRTVIVSNRIFPQCIARIGVDGEIREQGFEINSIPPNDVYGIEVFNGAASMPAEYGGTRGGMCALVMVWLKRL